MKLFLVELQSRPDGIVNQSINSYSTEAMTRAMYHQRYANAITNTTFTKVTLLVFDEFGNIIENSTVKTQYQEQSDT